MPPKKKITDKSEWYIIVDNCVIHHGDKITATIKGSDDEDGDTEFDIEDARLCINEVDESGRAKRAWICQNVRNGCEEAHDKFEYDYSWTFVVNAVGEIESEDTTSVAPVKELQSVMINDVTFEEGELVVAELRRGQSSVTTEARINILSTGKICLCQNAAAGCSEFRDPDGKQKSLYGYNYGWQVELRRGKIISGDTIAIHKAPKSKPVETPKKQQVEDDDMMPADWIPTGKDLEFLTMMKSL